MTLIENDTVNVIDGPPPAIPHRCVACGISGNDRRYIDFNLDIPEYGVIYLCEICYTMGAKKLGWSPPGDTKQLRDYVGYWRNKYDGARREVASELYSQLVSSNIFADVHILSNVPAMETDTANEQESRNDSETESDTDKSDDERRFADLLNLEPNDGTIGDSERDTSSQSE